MILKILCLFGLHKWKELIDSSFRDKHYYRPEAQCIRCGIFKHIKEKK